MVLIVLKKVLVGMESLIRLIKKINFLIARDLNFLLYID